jgi:hypothetical protein
MTTPGFGDRVRIVTAPETVASGFAGRVGEVWSESAPSVSGAGPVIGDRGEDLALSVLFEETEDLVWFAPHLVERVERVAFRSRLVSFLLLAAFALPIATAIPGVGASAVRRLALINAATPCFPVQGYVTSGVFPNVRGSSLRVARTNIELRRAVIADQRRFAAGAGRSGAAPHASGIYETAVERRLVSASTVVVSALIPALELYPGGNDGQTWISATIDVRSGRLVSLRDLLANPRLALPLLVKDWKDRLRNSTLWSSVAEDPAGYTPTLAHYRYFALTPTGLAFGHPQEPAGSRFAAVIPYRLVHPYLSPLGRRLVAGVRRPRPAGIQGRGELAWAGLEGFFPGVARNWPLTCSSRR